MKPITLPVAELKPALVGFGKIISRRATLPILGCLRIERTREGFVELTANNLDMAATLRLRSTDQDEPVCIVIPLEDLASVIKSASRNDHLALSLGEDSKATIQFTVAGNPLEHRCPALPANEFPVMPEMTGEPIALDASLRSAIHDAFLCASTDETRAILNSAYLDVSKAGAHYVVATDGRHLFSSNSFTLPIPESLVIPSRSFFEWKGFREEDGHWRLRMQRAIKDQPPVFELASDHWRCVALSCEGTYPNWRQVVPASKDLKGHIEFPPETVEGVLQTITRLPDHDAINHTIGIAVQNGGVRLLAKPNGDQPWTAIEVPDAKVSTADITVLVNRLLLLKALRFGLTRIDLIDARSPVRFSAGGRQMVVMTIRPDCGPTAPATTTPPAPPADATSNPPPQPAEQPKEEPTMPANNGIPTPGAQRTETITEEPKPALDLALAQIEVVRGEIRSAIAGANKLGDLLKQVQREQKTTEKEISSVRATLRSLQSVRI